MASIIFLACRVEARAVLTFAREAEVRVGREVVLRDILLKVPKHEIYTELRIPAGQVAL